MIFARTCLWIGFIVEPAKAAALPSDPGLDILVFRAGIMGRSGFKLAIGISDTFEGVSCNSKDVIGVKWERNLMWVDLGAADVAFGGCP